MLFFLLMQEEIVDETDEFVDVHKRYLKLWGCIMNVGHC